MDGDGRAVAGAPERCSALVYHPERVVAEAIAGTLQATGVARRTSTADRLETLLTSREVPALVVMASVDDGAIADICEALVHRRLVVPVLSVREGITAGGVVQDLLDGASGVGDLRASPRRFAAVARTVAGGGLTIPVSVRPAALRALVQAAGEHAQARERLLRMTPRQRQVLALMAMGHGHGGVAARLGLSVTTARTHADQVRSKLDAASQLSAAIEARRTLVLGTAPTRPVEALFGMAEAASGPGGGALPPG